MRHFGIPILLLTLFGLSISPLTVSPLLAAGGGAASAESAEPVPAPTPEQMAASEYNAGLRLRDKAWKLEEKAAAADEAQRAKLLEKVDKNFEKAIGRFTKATKINPRMHQAWSSLGYALRRTGQYEASLEAYGQALELAPNYSEAIEYRAEAYLGLGRLDDAKKAYMMLFGHDRPRADELLEAMQEWIEARRQDPGDVGAEVLESFAGWVSERAEVAGQVAEAAGSANASW